MKGKIAETKELMIPIRVYAEDVVYTVIKDYEFGHDGNVIFKGHVGLENLKKSLVSFNLKAKDIRWFEYKSVDGLCSIRNQNVELINRIYIKWFSVFGGNMPEFSVDKEYVSWHDFYEKERVIYLK